MKNVHILSTDKPSRLVQRRITKEVKISSLNNPQLWNNINIYITSDEKPKKDDWFIHPDSSCFDKEWKEVSVGGYEILKVIKVDEDFIYHSSMMAIHKNLNIKKIILTTDTDLINDGVQPIDDEFLEWFVKNPSCEFVEVMPIGFEDRDDYLIMIPQEEPKQEIIQKFIEKHGITEQQLIDGYKQGLDLIFENASKIDKQETLEEVAKKQWGNVHRTGVLGFIEGANWQAERMYSEEECYKYLHSLMTDIELKGLKVNDDTDLKQWFVQFKKK